MQVQESLIEKYLGRLLILDVDCKNVKSNSDTTNLDKLSMPDDVPTNLSNLDDFWNSDGESDTGGEEYGMQNTKITSHDLSLSSILLSDNFLRQEIYEKMSACQMAIPIVLPSPTSDNNFEFALWSTRMIKKKWRSSEDTSHDALITAREMPLIAFCRLSDIAVSKSSIVNSFISTAMKCDENEFFISNSESNKPQLCHGCIEAVFASPEGRKDQKLSEICTVLNQRGSAKDYPEQFSFLLKTSSFMVIFVNSRKEIDKATKKCLKEEKKLIIIVELGSKSEVTAFEHMIFLPGFGKDKRSLGEEICNIVSNNMGKETLRKSLVCHSKSAADFKFSVDEELPECKKGREMAENLISSMENLEKKDILPLQGDFWKEWSRHDKESSRHNELGSKDGAQYSAELYIKMKNTRKEQKDRGLSVQMKEFLKNIHKLQGDTRQFFLLWCQLFLNEKSEKILEPLHKEFNDLKVRLSEAKQKIETSRTKTNEETQYNELKKDMNIVILRMQTTSLGIEHLFRELGQFYECDKSLHGKERLPEIMAELILIGIPLEIMDGDVSHVPITWTKDVLKALADKLNDCKVFVNSILGIQSSGKSTVLNTMYGLRFAVSSGRCTRGAFFQLVPVHDGSKKRAGCDYFLVIDTEGLRSPELGEDVLNDNELATFVSALANNTILNLWGQTFTPDIKDVMQIVIHACMRMTEVSLKGSFHVMFAGVSDASAKERNAAGVTNIFEALEKLGNESALKNNREDLIGKPDKVFPLLSKKDKSLPEFLPALWHGSMAKPSGFYGELLEDVKIGILKMLEKRDSLPPPIAISDFSKRLESIWEGIKREKFVFVFKNAVHLDLQSKWNDKFTTLKTESFKSMMEMYKTFEKKLRILELNETSTLVDDTIFEFEEIAKNKEEDMTKELESFCEDIDITEIKTRIYNRSMLDIEISMKMDLARFCQKIQRGEKKIQKLKEQETVEEKQEKIRKELRQAAFLLVGIEATSSAKNEKFSAIFDRHYLEAESKEREVMINGSTFDRLWTDFSSHLDSAVREINVNKVNHTAIVRKVRDQHKISVSTWHISLNNSCPLIFLMACALEKYSVATGCVKVVGQCFF